MFPHVPFLVFERSDLKEHLGNVCCHIVFILTAGMCKSKSFPLLYSVLIFSTTTHSTQGCKVMFAGSVTALSSCESVCVRVCVCPLAQNSHK